MWELAQQGIDILATDCKGINALQLASIKNYPHIVKMLLDSKYPENLVNDDGMNALQMAAQIGNI
jgi:ankyrin repeat protein